MTEAMPFLRKLILLSYDPRPCAGEIYFSVFSGLCMPLLLRMRTQICMT